MKFTRVNMFLLLVFVIAAVPSYVNAQKEQALNQPIVEGKSMLGIEIGDSESDIWKVLGFPDEIRSNFMDIPSSIGKLKVLSYGLDSHAGFFIFTRNSKVEVMEIVWSGEGIPAYKGKTTKGIGLGDSMEHVNKYYGECEIRKEMCWYKKYGISIGGEKVITFILIASPGELPDYLFTKQPHL
ncbi:MAG: hypothetical protein HZC48_01845 [Nitrospirae bacterium]|nr:hypothetical protein [Nitrospirota bacterium]